MSPEMFVEVFRRAFSLVVILVVAIATPSLIVGLIVAIFQAATSINEQTLSFLPRLVVTLIAMMWMGHWIFGEVINLFLELVADIPSIVG